MVAPITPLAQIPPSLPLKKGGEILPLCERVTKGDSSGDIPRSAGFTAIQDPGSYSDKSQVLGATLCPKADP